MSSDEIIRRTIELAKNAREKGNHPFGACLTLGNKIILEAENTVNTDANPSCHAEMNLINLAWRSLSKEDIEKSTLYTSCEPCPMCTGAIFWSGIRKVIFSLPAETLGKIAHDKFCGPCIELFERSEIKTEVIGPVLENEGMEVHKNFWT